MPRPARALIAAICALALLGPGAGSAEARVLEATRAPNAGSVKPEIVWKKIPFGVKRRRQTAGYSKRHYGERAWELTDPHVVVEHYTTGDAFQSTWNYFAANVRHLGEMPGVCSHFVIDSDGTIYQLVNLAVRCRHTIGLNWTAVGIEMVGTSDDQILHRRPQLRAALHLTLWLMARYGIELRNVIGHAESLTSPYHHELYADWHCMTHSDWLHPDMKVFRRKLKRLATRNDVPIGPRSEPIHPNC